MTRRKAYLLVQSVLCILIAGLLAAGTIQIYREGMLLRESGRFMEWIYTREKVTEKLAPIFPVFCLAFGMTLAGWILGIQEGEKEKPVRDVRLLRDLSCFRVAVPSEAMKKERSRQNWLRVIFLALALLSLVPGVLYLVEESHFESTDLESVVGSLVLALLPWVVLFLAILFVGSLLIERSMVRETEAAKERIQEEKAQNITPSPAEPGRKGGMAVLRVVLLGLSVCFIVLGIFNGSMRDVLAKAVKICTECIGLG